MAIPTGTNFDPEEAVSVGTNLWQLHAAGDVEAHVSADRHFFVDEYGAYRLNVDADLFYSFFRPREYKAGYGLKNPLLSNNAFFVGDTYLVDGGDWLAGTLSVDAVPVQGYARYQSGDLIPGAYTRPANVFTAGVRIVAKFW